MNILVTGGAGFLGSNLCKYLISKGDKVICLDNFHSGSIENIKTFLSNPKFRFIEHDITNPITFSEKIDQIYNLACPASPKHYQGKFAIQTTKTCVLGILNMLELARKHQCPILQASTSEVYGNPRIHPQIEQYWGNVNPIGIRSCYDEGKRCAESLCFDYYRQYGVAIKVVRIFNTYGPNMRIDDGRVISSFICQAIRGEDITIFGDGSQTRSFCYVDDLIDGLYRMMNSSNELLGPINLGNPGEFTMNELAKIVLSKINTTSKIVYKSLPQDDPVRRKPDISMASKLLKWHPKITLMEGLDKTIAYFEGKNK